MPQIVVGSWGNSEAVRLPKSLCQQIGIQTGTVLEAEFMGGSIVLTPAQANEQQVGSYHIPSVNDLFDGYCGRTTVNEWDTGFLVGEEYL